MLRLRFAAIRALLLSLLVTGGLATPPAHAATMQNDVTIGVTCVEEQSDTTYRARFRWSNATEAVVWGSPNRFVTTSTIPPGYPPDSLGPNAEGQDTTNTIPKVDNVTWELNGMSATATWGSSPRCRGVDAQRVAPVVIGRMAVGETVTVGGEVLTHRGGAYDVEYFWLTCEPGGSYGTQRSYTIKPADLGKRLQASVQYRDLVTRQLIVQGVTDCDATPPVGAAPGNTAAPTVTGEPTVGATLALSGGTWTGTDLQTPTVRWEACDAAVCAPVGSAATYSPAAGDVGRTVRAVVTSTNALGAFAVTTAATGSVDVADTSGPSVAPQLTGPAGAGGWRTGDVAVAWDVADDGAAITARAGCDPVTVSEDVRRTLTCTARSRGGATTETVEVLRDASPPSKPVFAGIAAGTYRADRLPGRDAVGCTAADPTSGAACAVSGWSGDVGEHTLTATATNGAGLTSTATLTYRVEAAPGDPQPPASPMPEPQVVTRTVTVPAPPAPGPGPTLSPSPAPAPAPAAADPWAALRELRSPKVDATKVAFAQTLPGAGSVTWTVTLAGKRLGRTSTKVDAAGTRDVTVRLAPAARRALRADRRGRVTVTTAFSPRGGGTFTVSRALPR